MSEPCCMVCERVNGEDDCVLIPINTAESVAFICDNCNLVSLQAAITKCRNCGAVATIPWDRTPFQFARRGWQAIAFVDECKFCGGKECPALDVVMS
jgi:hypothetical protein